MTEQQVETQEGRIKWFGGYNSKTGQDNNFGFIEDNNVGDIYVHGSEIYQNDIPMLRENLVVNYRLQFDKNKSKYKAVQVKAKKVLGISSTNPLNICEYLVKINDGKTVRLECRKLNLNSNIDVQQVLDSVSLIDCIENLSKLIKCFIFYKQEQYLSKLIDNFLSFSKIEKTETEVVSELAISNPYLLKTFPNIVSILEDKSIIQVFQNPDFPISEEAIIEQLLDAVTKVKSNVEIIENLNILWVLPYFATHSNLWSSFSTKTLTTLYTLENVSSANFNKDKLLNIIIQKIESEPGSENLETWEKIEPLRKLVTYHDRLWNIAPTFIKAEIIRNQYHRFFQVMDAWRSYEPRYLSTIRISCKDAYQFTADDIKIVHLWSGNPQENTDQSSISSTSKFLSSTMYSARGAERATIIHYQKRNTCVVDTAIHQVTKISEEWKFCDLRVEYDNKQKLLDVKNARSNLSNRNRFSEFCVPKFKNRDNSEVKIAAVFSPYISNLSEAYSGSGTITILGETQYSSLQVLQSRCSELCPKLKIAISKISNLKGHYLSEYLPPWLFDFDNEFYKDRYEIEKGYRSLNPVDIPPLSDLNLLNLTPFSLALCAKRQIPHNWKQDVEPAIIRFAEILNFLVGDDEDSLTLAHLFLAILIHFLENCLSPIPSFSPEIYRKLIFIDSSRMVMGICDPLGIIEDTCNILGVVWETCANKLSGFSYFKFDSRGLLQGFDPHTQSFVTIIAYCGGWKIDADNKPKGLCGNEPLDIGHHKTCPHCNKLICDQCGFCSKICTKSTPE